MWTATWSPGYQATSQRRSEGYSMEGDRKRTLPLHRGCGTHTAEANRNRSRTAVMFAISHGGQTRQQRQAMLSRLIGQAVVSKPHGVQGQGGRVGSCGPSRQPWLASEILAAPTWAGTCAICTYPAPSHASRQTSPPPRLGSARP